LNRTPDALQTELQAAEWLIRLDADASTASLAEWRQWLQKSARHRATYIRLQRGWRETDCLKRLCPLDGNVKLDLLDSFPGLRPVAQERTTAVPRAKGHHRKLAATMLAVIFGVALMLAT
jgi:ferric-dicitrate binding protein FerR (iron transport regulator)